MSQWGVGALAHFNCSLGLALIPVEDDAVVVCGHPCPLRVWCFILRLLCPMVGRQEHSLEGWNIQQVWHPYGVHLSVIVFQPELECSNSLDGDALSEPINLLISLNKIEVAVKLVCVVCHAV